MTRTPQLIMDTKMLHQSHCKSSFILYFLLLFMTACTMSQQPIGNPEAPYPPPEQPTVGDIYHLPTGVKVTADQMNVARKIAIQAYCNVRFCIVFQVSPERRFRPFAPRNPEVAESGQENVACSLNYPCYRHRSNNGVAVHCLPHLRRQPRTVP